MQQFNILPYHPASKSAKALATTLGVARLKLEGSKFRPAPHKHIINWGSAKGAHPAFKSTSIFNTTKAVGLASNKLRTFEAFEQNKVPTVEFTSDPDVAVAWGEEGLMVVGRSELNAHSGRGIYLFTTPDFPVDEFPLFTKYLKKQDEFRVHVIKGEVIDIQRKALRATDNDGIPIDPKNVNYQVRNHANGFIYARNNIQPPKGINDVAIAAVASLGLDFGAVDIIYNAHYSRLAALEVNTAPGLEGETLINYANYFQNWLDKRQRI